MTIRFVTLSVLILSSILLFSLTLSAHATTSYLAGVSPGNYANYSTVKATFHTDNPLFPEPQYLKDLNATVLNKITVQTVSSPATNVTAASYTVFQNRTSTLSTVFGDLDTGMGNLTYGLIAGGLVHPEPIWNNATAPTINDTTTMNFLGSSRTVNILNLTKTFTISGVHFSTMEYYVWDQASGIALRVIGSGSFTSIYGNGDFDAEVAISATNIFTTSQSQDFQITTSTNSITVVPGAKATSIITVTPLYGFAGDTLLSTSISPSSGLTCTLSPTTITGGSGTSTLSCSGSTGNYAVTITASSGSLSHTRNISVSVTSVQPSSAAPPATIFGLAPTLFYGIIGVIAIVVIAGVVVLLRMRSDRTPSPVPSWSPSGPTTSP